MTRVKRGKIISKLKRKKTKTSKGFRCSWSTLSRPMMQGYLRATNFSYKDRKKKYCFFRKLSIVRLNALLKSSSLPITYNQLMFILKIYECKLNRKIVNQLGIRDNSTFLQLVKFCRY